MSTPERPEAGPTDPVALNRKAVFSIVCGIVAFALIYVEPVGGLLVAVPSITSGLHARREIVAAHGLQSGDSAAVIGLMIGGGAIVTVVLSWLLPVVTGR